MLIQIDEVSKQIIFEANHIKQLSKSYKEISPDITPTDWAEGYHQGLMRGYEIIKAQEDLEAIKEAKELPWQSTK